MTFFLVEVAYSIYLHSRKYAEIDPVSGEKSLMPGSVRYKRFLRNAKQIKIEINSLGWRDREIPIQKQEGTFRIVVVGDSITFGWGVELEETYVKQLEAILRLKTPDKNYEIINMGIEGIGLYDALQILKRYGLKFRPDLVLLGFYLNDAKSISPSPQRQWK